MENHTVGQNTVGQNRAHASEQTAADPMFEAGRRLLEHDTAQNGEMNVGNRERILSLILGAVGILWLGKRLFGYGALAILSVYLLYRGLTGFCAIYARAHVDTRAGLGSDARSPMTGESSTQFGTHQAGMPAAIITVDRTGHVESGQAQTARKQTAETAKRKPGDTVEEASKQSFPASDPPAY